MTAPQRVSNSSAEGFQMREGRCSCWKVQTDFNVNRTVAEADLTDPGWGSTGQVQVRRGEAESDLDLTCTTSAGVARGSTPPTPLKSTKVKSRYNEAKPSCTWTWPRWTWAEVVRGGHHRLHSSPPRPSPGTTRRSRVVPGLGRGGLELKLYEVATEDSTQVHQGYMTRRKASTPRRSRGVLVLSPSQHCARVGEVHLRYCGILD